MYKRMTILMAVLIACSAAAVAADEGANGWVTLFDGKSMNDWKAGEHTDSWSIQDGAIVAKGPRSHLFYVGPEAPFKNFHFKCEVMTKPRSNSGIYFHSKFQEQGWPKFGYEAQVNNSGGDPKRTGSLYAVKNVTEAPAKDNEWFTEEIIVEGKRIQIKVNGKTVVDFTEEPDRKPGKDFTRILSEGTFAFQAHDPGSQVHFRNIKVKRLP